MSMWDPLPEIPLGTKCEAPNCGRLATFIYRVDVSPSYSLMLDHPTIRAALDRGIAIFDRVYYVGDCIYACADCAYTYVWKPGTERTAADHMEDAYLAHIARQYAERGQDIPPAYTRHANTLFGYDTFRFTVD
jgi:hypothetical protein